MKIQKAPVVPYVSARRPDQGEPENSEGLSARQIVRFANSGVVQLGLGDAPAAVAMGMQSGLLHLSGPAQRAVNGINGLNLILNVGSTLIDLKQMRDVNKSDKATPKDKKVELVHFLVGDLLPTATAAMPLLMSLHNPIVGGLFLASQTVGIGADIYKFGYDVKRGGNQA